MWNYMMNSAESYNSMLQKFRQLHSEIIENYQCIEYDMRLIYSSMCADDWDDTMDELSEDNWGTLLRKLKDLDYSDNKPYLSEEDYELLDEIRTRRNYWSHQCYLVFVYMEDSYERDERLRRMLRQIENEGNRAAKLQRKMENMYLNY